MTYARIQNITLILDCSCYDSIVYLYIYDSHFIRMVELQCYNQLITLILCNNGKITLSPKNGATTMDACVNANYGYVTHLALFVCLCFFFQLLKDIAILMYILPQQLLRTSPHTQAHLI